MTPVAIEILMYHHYRGGPHPNVGAKSVKDALTIFIDHNILTSVGKDRYKTTARGKVFVEMLCDTPVPVESWKDPRV